jgi:ATP-dependent Lhr-like helicase
MVLPGESAGEKESPGGEGFFDRARDVWEIKDRLQMEISSCAEFLRREAWEGRLTADTWEPIRQGIRQGWKTPGGSSAADAELPAAYGRGRLPRALRDRWKSGAPVRGNWFSLERDGVNVDAAYPRDLDPWDEEELNRDRVRLLLERWGILCRPLLEKEEPPLTWGRLLPAMRRMELAGEITAGRFIGGINSLQFAVPGIAEELEAAEAEENVYWMNAADPASPAGLAVEGLDPRLPPRLASSRLCFRGTELIAVANRGARDLRIFPDPGETCLIAALAFLKVPRTRAFLPDARVLIETVNGVSAAGSPYAEILNTMGFVRDREKLVLW